MAESITKSDIRTRCRLLASIYYGQSTGVTAHEVEGITTPNAGGLNDAVAAVKADRTAFPDLANLQAALYDASYLGDRGDAAIVVTRYRDKPDNTPRWLETVTAVDRLSHWRRNSDGTWTLFTTTTIGGIITAYPMRQVKVQLFSWHVSIDRTEAQIDAWNTKYGGFVNANAYRGKEPATVYCIGVGRTPRVENGAEVQRATFRFLHCPRGFEAETATTGGGFSTDATALAAHRPANGSGYVPGTFGDVLPTATFPAVDAEDP